MADALSGRKNARMTTGIKHPLYLAMLQDRGPFAWIWQVLDLVDNAIQAVYVQVNFLSKHTA